MTNWMVTALKWLGVYHKAKQLESAWTLQTDDRILYIGTICCIATSALFLLFYAPYLSYHLYQYYQRRHHIVFRKRRNRITHWEVSIFIIKIFWGVVLYNLLLLVDTTSITFSVCLCIDDCLLFIILYCWVWRFWILYFDISWTVHVLNNQWKVLINRSSTKSNWYLMNKKRYGSSVWLFWRYIGPLMLLSCILVIINAVIVQIPPYSDNYVIWGCIQLWGCILEIVPYGLLVWMFRRAQRVKFHDNFHIAQELKYIFIALTIDNIANILLFCGNIFLYEDPIWYRIVIPCAGNNIIWGTQFAACLISTKWVTSKVQPILDGRQYEVVRKKLVYGSRSDLAYSSVQFLHIQQMKDSFPSTLTSSSYSQSQSQSTSGEPCTDDHGHGHSAGFTWNKNRNLLLKLLSDPQGFQAFILHLSSEFSVETILFLIEVMQFQSYIKERCHYDLISESHSGRSISEGIVFPNDIPNSEIVYADDFKDSRTEDFDEEMSVDLDGDDESDIELLYAVKVKAVKLYRKYVAPHAELEVNLSYHCKRQLTKLMGNNSVVHKWLRDNSNVVGQFRGLLGLYEESCTQIFALIIDSFNRFKHTASYAQLKRFKIFDD